LTFCTFLNIQKKKHILLIIKNKIQPEINHFSSSGGVNPQQTNIKITVDTNSICNNYYSREKSDNEILSIDRRHRLFAFGVTTLSIPIIICKMKRIDIDNSTNSVIDRESTRFKK